MKKFLLLVCLVSGFFSFNSFKLKERSSTKTIIIQFKNNNFEKRIPEIVFNLKGIKGIVYISHCVSQNLFVMNFDLMLTGGFPVEKSVKEKIPVGLSYEFKEGTFYQIKDKFSNCLIEEAL